MKVEKSEVEFLFISPKRSLGIANLQVIVLFSFEHS